MAELITRENLLRRIAFIYRRVEEPYQLTDYEKGVNHGLDMATEIIETEASYWKTEVSFSDPECHWVDDRGVYYKFGVKPIIRPQWIPVTERLPDHTDEYLVTWEFDHHRMVIVAWYARINHNSDPCFHYVNDDGEDVSLEGEVLAWMPLPEPYKEDIHG